MTGPENRDLVDGERARYSIASTTVELQFGRGPASEILRREMSVYARTDSSPEAVIRISPPVHASRTLARNPSIHNVTDNGFVADFGRYSVAWSKKEYISVDLVGYDEHRKNLLRKLANIEFAHPFEDIGRIFHEIVLIPTIFMYFSERCAIAHASAVRSRDGRGILVTGTGGVGKTSLMLSLVQHHGWQFISDDISFVGSDGTLWINGAYPKIYAYNVDENDPLWSTLMRGRSLIDRMQWNVKRYAGRSRVRRRLDPRALGSNDVAQRVRLDTVYVICRRQVDKIRLERLPAEKTVDLSLSLLQPEYGVIVNHLHWHEFNLKALGKPSCITLGSVLSNMRNVLLNAYRMADCFLMSVPLDYSTKRLQSEFLSACETGPAH